MKISAHTTEPVPSPLLYDAEAVRRASKIAILVPGALARIDIFETAAAWQDAGYALVYYRFPGLDGRALKPALNIAQAARDIAEFAGGYPGKQVRLLGYSTGGPIVIAAAELIVGDVKVAAMSSAVERAGGMTTALRGAMDVAKAARRVRTLRRSQIWLEYYKTLLFGRSAIRDPAQMRVAEDLVAAQRDKIVLPEGGLPQAHARDLRRWRLPTQRLMPAEKVRLFIGLEDPVFSTAQTVRFAVDLGGSRVIGYRGHGHLLFATHLGVFDDVLAFFEDTDPVGTTGVDVPLKP